MKKKLLSIITLLALCLSLLPTAALAQDTTYELWIGGVRVTSANTEITSDDFTGVAGVAVNGKATFSSDDNGYTLTLTNFTLTGGTDTPAAIHYSGSGTLRLVLSGTNTVTGPEVAGDAYGIYVPNGSLTVEDSETPGTLTATGGASTGGTSYGVYVLTGSISVTSGSLTGKSGAATSGYGVYAYSGISVEEGGSLTGDGTGDNGSNSYTYTGESYGVYTGGGISVNGGELTGTGGASTNGASYGVYATTDITVSSTENGTATVTGTGGTATNGSAGVYAYSTISVNGGELRGKGGEVNGTGRNSEGVFAISTISISGGKLTGTGIGTSGNVGCGVRTNGGISVTGGKLEGTATGDSGGTSYGVGGAVTISGGEVEAQGGSWAFSSAPTIDKNFANAKVWCGESEAAANITDAEGYHTSKYVRIVAEAVTAYNLWIGGVQMHSANTIIDKNDNAGFTGTAAYDPATNTLTLTSFGSNGVGYTWTDEQRDDSCCAAICYGGTNELKLVLEGASSVTAPGSQDKDSTFGLYTGGALTVSGSGSLTATAGAAAKYSYGVCAMGGIKVTGGSLTGAGGEADYSNGVITTEIEVTGGSLTGTGGAAGSSYGVCAALGGITVSGGTLTGTGGATDYKSYGVYADACSIQVSGTGSLTGTGGTVTNGSTNTNESYGVYADNSSPYDPNKGDITVSGSGSLTGKGGKVDHERGTSYGVYAEQGDITVSDTGSLTGAGGEAGNASRGVYASSTITVSGGLLAGTGGTAGNSSIGAQGNATKISGGVLTGTGGAAKSSRGVIGGDTTVAGSGSLTGIGGTATGDNATSYGVNVTATLSGGVVVAQGGTAAFYSPDGSSYKPIIDNSFTDAKVWLGESESAADIGNSVAGKNPTEAGENYHSNNKYVRIAAGHYEGFGSFTPTGALPDGTVGAAYRQAFTTAAPIKSPVIWSLDGGSLPDGLTLDAATGIISGTPTREGTFEFFVKATDGIAYSTNKVSITIADHEHDWTETMGFDDTHHWRQCAGAGTCTVTVNTQKGSYGEHSFGTEWSKDAGGHWHECSVCHYKKDSAAHTPGAAATATTPQTCTECGYVIKSATGGSSGGSGCGSSDSGSDDGSASSSTPAASVTVPISGDENTINVDASVKGDKATIDEVDLSHLDTVIGDNVSTGTVTIDFSGLNSKEPITTVEIPSDVVHQIAAAVNDPANDAESLEIVLSDGTSIEFDAVALGEKSAQAGGLDITISILPASKAEVNDKQKDAIGDRPFYDISVTSGGKHISDMGGKITIHAPYTLSPGEKARSIVVWYVDDEGNRERCETSFDPVKGRLNWKTDHLSVYMIDHCPSAFFDDLDTSLWYHEATDYVIENGIMAGYGETFGPNDSITRGQIVTILWRLENSPVVNYLLQFEDVAAEKYYTEAIRWAASEGIASGYGNGRFGPDDPITRQQLAAMLWRYAQHTEQDVSVGDDTNILSYEDAFDISEYAIPAMQWACGTGVMGGYGNGYLGPNDGATRAQAAAMLQRYCELPRK